MNILRWLGDHQVVVIVLIAAISICLIVAMAFGYDLSWIPGLLARMLWNQ